MRNRMFEQRPFRLGTARMEASLKLIYKLELRFCLCHPLTCDAPLLCALCFPYRQNQLPLPSFSVRMQWIPGGEHLPL